MIRAVLSFADLRSALVRVISGTTITEVAKDLGVERSSLSHRLKRNFPEEYAAALASGVISPGATEQSYAKRRKVTETCPAVHAYLHGEGTLQEVADRFGMPLSTLGNRVRRLKMRTDKKEQAAARQAEIERNLEQTQAQLKKEPGLE